MRNKVFVATVLGCILQMSFVCSAIGEDDREDSKQTLKDFNWWASLLGSRYSYDSIRDSIPETGDYIIIAELNTRPTYVTALTLVKGEASTFLYLSSITKRTVSCSTTKSTFNIDIANDEAISKVDDQLVEIHPYYTIIEKRKNGFESLFTFNGYYNSQLRKEVDSLKNQLQDSMLSECPDFIVSNAE